jgi:chemotaxis methyl-accepting protein methylase
MTSSQASDTVEDRVAGLLLERIGLRPDPTVRGRLHRAVRDELDDGGHDPETYLQTLARGGGALQGLLNRITVQETAFFRHPEQFEALVRDVLPTLPQPVKIWSAGCANGQEPYSVAMLLEEQGIAGSVIGTDLSTSALRRTATARYSAKELSGLSSHRIARHLTRTDDSWEIKPAIRRRVSTRYHNLLDPLPPEVRSCQVIFCRNVLIYLSHDHTSAFLSRIADTFPPTTAVFLGAAETIWQVSDRFRAVPAGDTFIHRQVTGDPAGARARAGRRSQRAAPSAPMPRAHVLSERAGSSEAAPVRRAALSTSTDPPESATSADLLARAGQDAIATGDFGAAVVAFRKCAYLAPHDPIAQLHLGLALDAAGDERSAQRAYAAARHALLNTDPAHSVGGIEGYASAELGSLLDSRQRRATP